MMPAFLPGDMVTVARETPALVISVTQANGIPDVHERGLSECQPWSFWVVTGGTHPRFLGPFGAWDLEAAGA